jgi:hypothetical protein
MAAPSESRTVQVFVLDKRLKRRITMGDEKTNVTMDANKFYSQHRRISKV